MLRTVLLLGTLLVGACWAQAPDEAVALHADEDARRADPVRWKARLAADDPRLRADAARAIGRIRDAELAPLLVERYAAGDDDGVRYAIVFALGQLEAGRETLVKACADPVPSVRVGALEALGKLPAEVSSAACFANGLVGEQAEVAAAFLACARAYGRRVQPPPEVPEALSAALSEAVAQHLSGELAWQASYALAEVVGLADGAELVAALGATDPTGQVFVARGLGRLESMSAEAREALHGLLQSGSPHAAAAAAWALGKHPDPASHAALKAVVGERTGPTGFHVRAAAVQALAAPAGPDPADASVTLGWVAWLSERTQDPSPSVRRVALAALATRGALSAADVRRFSGADSSAADRQSLAMALSVLPGPPSLTAAKALRDTGLEGAERAALVEALVAHDRSWLELVRTPTGLRGFVQAVLEASALGTAGRLADLPALAAHYRHALPRARQGALARNPTRPFGDPLAWAEARTAVVSAAQAIVERERYFAPFGPEAAARALLTAALDDPDGTVREAAADALGALYGARPEVEPPVPVPSSVPFNAADLDPAPLEAVLHTSVGPLTLELLVQDAPRHAKSFARLAEAGFYDGLTFHRIVSGFVAQGLCPLGNGWGTGGVHLNDEINPVPYLRGAVGMPSSGPDTAGCQIFVTHVPTPHLDGNYTVFARVLDGWAVLDALDLDHVVERVELLRQ